LSIQPFHGSGRENCGAFRFYQKHI
jgi:hypothetical protein